MSPTRGANSRRARIQVGEGTECTDTNDHKGAGNPRQRASPYRRSARARKSARPRMGEGRGQRPDQADLALATLARRTLRPAAIDQRGARGSTAGRGRRWPMKPISGQRAFAFLDSPPDPPAARAGTQPGPPCTRCGGYTVVSAGVGPHQARADCADPACRAWRWLPRGWKNRRPV
jgi:hypothetical protein